jgi:hypothetical protein
MICGYGAVGGMRIGRGNRITRENRLNDTMSTINPTCSDLRSNTGRQGGNRLSYVMAVLSRYKCTGTYININIDITLHGVIKCHFTKINSPRIISTLQCRC